MRSDYADQKRNVSKKIEKSEAKDVRQKSPIENGTN
jgi:hypothetical protein